MAAAETTGRDLAGVRQDRLTCGLCRGEAWVGGGRGEREGGGLYLLLYSSGPGAKCRKRRLRNFLSATMVKVQIVDEKDEGSSSPYASDDDARTSSSVSLSSVDSDTSADESFLDRIAALVDIVPPSTRHSISSRISRTAAVLKRGGKIAGNIVWVVTTSALLVALPLALSLEDEAKIVAQEKEMLEQQQGAQQVSFSLLFPPHQIILHASQMLAPSMYPPAPGTQPKALVPPGF